MFNFEARLSLSVHIPGKTMNIFYHFFESIQNFMSRGGWVLYLIFATIFILWLLIVERFWYFHFNFKQDSKSILQKWKNRFASHSPIPPIMYLRLRKADLSRLKMLLNKNISNIKTLVALCPLMGLLGTVTGMVAVFEIMAEVGTGNARLMASGISMATIPTMAGMVGALSGIYVIRILENRTNSLSIKIEEKISYEQKTREIINEKNI